MASEGARIFTDGMDQTADEHPGIADGSQSLAHSPYYAVYGCPPDERARHDAPLQLRIVREPHETVCPV